MLKLTSGFDVETRRPRMQKQSKADKLQKHWKSRKVTNYRKEFKQHDCIIMTV